MKNYSNFVAIATTWLTLTYLLLLLHHPFRDVASSNKYSNPKGSQK
jgi:hypothetical protein